MFESGTTAEFLPLYDGTIERGEDPLLAEALDMLLVYGALNVTLGTLRSEGKIDGTCEYLLGLK